MQAALRFGRQVALSPAVHFAVLGLLAFAVLGPDVVPSEKERERLVVPPYIVESTRTEFLEAAGRPLTPAEEVKFRRIVADDEVLYQRALELGLDQIEVAERRLAQIATFVAENPEEGLSVQDRAAEAQAMGLDRGDRILRRMMVDAAERLIRAGALAREPKPELVEAYFEKHRDNYRLPGELALRYVTLRRSGGELPMEEAGELLARLRADEVAATRDVDVETLPALRDRDLRRRFGGDFVSEVAGFPEASWQGPVESRRGLHLVFVESRMEPRQPDLDEVFDDVRQVVRRKLADEWLELQLRELRARYEIVIDGEVVDDSELAVDLELVPMERAAS